ncbi:Fic family protein [Polaribacter sp. Hel1_85]|uniref:Fic family protein n=1 Tax=Polaribacter sp. Hel1_85 TaxID=1250005 RepID=UPI00052BD1FF|nr:Fic family protein [Polaribacter sp. Hel1_85]KGL62257.1 cell filamentation protein Fic [Polaribacter sp. Hel1_85]
MIEKAPDIEKNEKFKNLSDRYLSQIPFIIGDTNFKIEDEYLYWDKIKYIKNEDLNGFINFKGIKEHFKEVNSGEIIWTTVKRRRKSIQIRKSLWSSEFNLITYYHNINIALQQKLHYLDFNFGAGLQKEQLLSELEKQQYLKNALMEEAVFSSMIEGATTTRLKAKDMLRKNKKPKTHSEQMILNNYKTIQYISEHKEEDISIQKFYELHRLVTENTLEEESIGAFRKSNDVNVVNEITGDIIHTPPKFENLNGLMNSFVDFFNYNPKEDFIHPIVKASILHFLIGYIHPFVDGNGRTARAIFYWYLLKNGYWLTEYLSISRVIMETKVQYEKAYLYAEIDDMDVTYFIHYQVKVLTKAFEDLKKYVAKKKKEELNLLKFLQFEGINERQAEVLYKLEKNSSKYFTIKEIENTYSVTNQTARTDIEELVEKRFLKKVAINKKSFNYWKGENFDKTFL